MIVQIYEVTRPAEARALGTMRVDHIGVLVGDGSFRVVRPAGVDSKTKTDKSDGTHAKDLQRVSAFVMAARNTNGRTL